LKKQKQKKKPLNKNEAVFKIQKARSFTGFAFFSAPDAPKGEERKPPALKGERKEVIMGRTLEI
jgi:hypothetical protein